MAKPIEFVSTHQDTRGEAKRHLENAPVEHAAAVLSAFDLLEELHRAGALDVLRGAASACGEIVTQASSLAAQPESTRALRNLLVLTKLLGSIDPELLHRLGKAATAAVEKPREEPPSLFELVRRFNSPDSRRALATAADVLEGVGRGLGSEK